MADRDYTVINVRSDETRARETLKMTIVSRLDKKIKFMERKSSHKLTSAMTFMFSLTLSSNILTSAFPFSS